MPMKKLILAIAGLLLSSPAAAGIFADDLARCTVSSSTPEDRRLLVRWIFIVAASNPEFSDLASISATQRENGFRGVARVFDRLLLRDCRSQSVAAMRNEGGAGLEAGFRSLGQLAGREMMTSPAGLSSLQDLGRYMDQAGLAALRREAGVAEAPAS
jgi:hypothetical protein